MAGSNRDAIPSCILPARARVRAWNRRAKADARLPRARPAAVPCTYYFRWHHGLSLRDSLFLAAAADHDGRRANRSSIRPDAVRHGSRVCAGAARARLGRLPLSRPGKPARFTRGNTAIEITWMVMT